MPLIKTTESTMVIVSFWTRGEYSEREPLKPILSARTHRKVLYSVPLVELETQM
jgi:hypothetical protein